MSKKILMFILIIVLLCSVSMTSYAADNEELAEKPPVSLRFTYIMNAYTSLSITGGGLSTSLARMNAYPGVDSVRISMYLQRYNSGWTTVKHWAQDFDGTTGTLSKNWYVTSGYEYRVLSYFYAYDGNNTESTSLIHDDVWY